jgi:NTP pyrophosphatase (non-canonical NTP hydrolase)
MDWNKIDFKKLSELSKDEPEIGVFASGEKTTYRNQVLELWGCTNTEKDTMISSAMGLAGESGEYVDLLKKHLFHQHPLDKEKVKSELGDIRYYLEVAANVHGLDMGEIERANIEKLQKRYGKKFSSEASINRKE